MIRPFRRALRRAPLLALALVAALALPACGIKGPLKPPSAKSANTTPPPDIGPPPVTPGPVPPTPPDHAEPAAKQP